MKFKDVLSKVFDYRGKTPKKLGLDWTENGDILAISAKNIKKQQLVNLDKSHRGDEGLYHVWMKDGDLQPGDVLLTSEAPLGESYQVKHGDRFIVSQRVFGLRPNTNLVDVDYFAAYLSSNLFRKLLDSKATGTTVLGIKQSELLNLDIELPDINTQKKIGTLIRSLNAKIEITQLINDNLLELALAEYRQKVATTAITQMKLDDIAKVSAGGDKPKLVSDLASDEMRIPIYSNGITNEGLYGFTDTPKIFDKAVTVSARGTIGYLAIREEPYYPIVRLISVIPTLEKFTIHQLYLALTDTNIQGFGTTQQQLTVPVFKSTMLPILPEETRIEIEELISPMFDMIAHNKHEIVTLSETRDSLLKKLI